MCLLLGKNNTGKTSFMVIVEKFLEDFETANCYKLIKKDLKSVGKLIDFDIIRAKRSVSSSEEKTVSKCFQV